MRNTEPRSNCPINYSLEIFGDKWSLLILRDIIFRGKFSFLEFIKSEENIASNILANRLQILEAEEIILKKVSPKNGSKYIYHLTEKGAGLLPVLIEIMDWGVKYNSVNTKTPKKIIKQYRLDNKSLLKEYSKKLKAKLY